MTAPPTDDPRYTAALQKIETLERENHGLQTRLDTIGRELDAIRKAREVKSGSRHGGGIVVLGLVLVILCVFGAALIMYIQLRSEGPPPRPDIPGTPHGTAIPGFPPPPPDPGNTGQH